MSSSVISKPVFYRNLIKHLCVCVASPSTRRILTEGRAARVWLALIIIITSIYFRWVKTTNILPYIFVYKFTIVNMKDGENYLLRRANSHWTILS